MKKGLSAFALLVSGFALAGCASAASDPTAPLAEGTQVEIICRDVLINGMNQIERVCGTKEQWAERDRQAAIVSQDITRKLQGSAYTEY